MDRHEVQELLRLGAERNERYYAWLRHLLLLGSGALTVLVSLNAGTGSTGAAWWTLRAAWTLLGSGILTGAAALYGEVWSARALTKNVARRLTSRDPEDVAAAAAAVPIVSGRPPWWVRWSEPACYLSLASSVIALVASAWLRP